MNLADRLLSESLSRQSFWDFYALSATNGGQWDHKSSPLVESLWEELWSGIAKIVYARIGDPLLIEQIERTLGRSVSNPSEEDDGTTAELIIRVDDDRVEYLYDVVLEARTGGLDALYRAIKLAGDLPWLSQSLRQRYGGSWYDRFCFTGGTWVSLLKKTVGEFQRRHGSTAAKAASVDRMFSWTHHSGPVAEYIGQWLSDDLNFRADASVRELASRASPWVRSLMHLDVIGTSSSQSSNALLRSVFVVLRREADKTDVDNDFFVSDVSMDRDAVSFSVAGTHCRIVAINGTTLMDGHGREYHSVAVNALGKPYAKQTSSVVAEILMHC